MPFANYSLTKNGQMTIGQIFSPNYVPGVSGWQVAKNGDAEFNNVETRGNFYGTEFIINDAGAFFYSGTPANGNLLVSIAPVAGTDPFSNPYKAGFYIYGSNGQSIGLVEVSGQSILQLTPPSVTHLTDHPLVLGGAVNPGTASESMWALLTSGKSSSQDDAALQVFGESADGTIPARTVMEFGGTIALTVTKTQITPAVPIVTDSWHSLPLANSWVTSSDGLAAYKLTPENQVIIEAVIVSGTSTTICTLPAGYRPANRTMYFPVDFSGASTASVFGQLTPAGVLSLSSITSIGDVVINAVLPLDVP